MNFELSFTFQTSFKKLLIPAQSTPSNGIQIRERLIGTESSVLLLSVFNVLVNLLRAQILEKLWLKVFIISSPSQQLKSIPFDLICLSTVSTFYSRSMIVKFVSTLRVPSLRSLYTIKCIKILKNASKAAEVKMKMKWYWYVPKRQAKKSHIIWLKPSKRCVHESLLFDLVVFKVSMFSCVYVFLTFSQAPIPPQFKSHGHYETLCMVPMEG